MMACIDMAVYVAETGLLEAEKYLINSFMGDFRCKFWIAADGTVSLNNTKGCRSKVKPGEKYVANTDDIY